MPVWLKHKTLLFTFLIALIASHGFTRLYAAEININHVTSRVVNNIYLINAELDYHLGEKTIEALKSGIPLTFYIEVEFEQPRKLIWDRLVMRNSQEMRLEHHPLSDQYVLTNLATADQFSFNSLNDALLKLGRISNMPVTETRLIPTDTELIGRIRSGLDIESLPPPMRLQAWLSSEWRISSGWYEWDITP